MVANFGYGDGGPKKLCLFVDRRTVGREELKASAPEKGWINNASLASGEEEVAD